MLAPRWTRGRAVSPFSPSMSRRARSCWRCPRRSGQRPVTDLCFEASPPRPTWERGASSPGLGRCAHCEHGRRSGTLHEIRLHRFGLAPLRHRDSVDSSPGQHIGRGERHGTIAVEIGALAGSRGWGWRRGEEGQPEARRLTSFTHLLTWPRVLLGMITPHTIRGPA